MIMTNPETVFSNEIAGAFPSNRKTSYAIVHIHLLREQNEWRYAMF